MTPTQTAELLLLCAAYDQRTVGDADVRAWASLMVAADQREAVAVVQSWYAEHRERITPADIRAGVRKVRAERIARAPHTDPPPEVQGAGVAEYLAWLRRDIAAKASAPDQPVALPAGQGTELPADDRRMYAGLMRRMPT